MYVQHVGIIVKSVHVMTETICHVDESILIKSEFEIKNIKIKKENDIFLINNDNQINEQEAIELASWLISNSKFKDLIIKPTCEG